MYRIGFDVGGTFTDFTLLDETSGRLRHLKVASTPAAPHQAIVTGLGRIFEAFGMAPAEVGFLGHGTTVATNMVIEHRGAKTALLTTKGFRDILEIGRQTRPHLYDYSVAKPEPLVPRRRRFEVAERLDAEGGVVVELHEADVKRAIEALIAAGVEAVAVSYLHSYAEPAHEARTRALIEAAAPDLFISLSSEILPEFREYERTSTTVMNAYVGPRMADYLKQFAAETEALGIAAEPYTIHSNGGVMSLATARDYPVRTCLSGPAAGVVGAAQVAAAAGFPDVVTFDVGGTSTDVSLVREARPIFTSDRAIAGYPVRSPMLDIHVVGAGGGSIARVDDAGGLEVGPASAGAAPGPAAYGQGGERATLTDANLALGRLGTDGLAGGAMTLDPAAARAAIENDVAGPLGLDGTAAALGVVRVAVANMSRAIRAVSTERGFDLGAFALVAYGGAGPLHAAEVAVALGIGTVLVPGEPGTLCARGILMSDVSRDFVRTLLTLAEPETWPLVAERLAAMHRAGEAWLESEGVAPDRRAFNAVIDARYLGQNHEVRVALDDLSADGLAAFQTGFHEAHALAHGHALKGREVEIVNCRLQALGRVTRAVPEAPPAQSDPPATAIVAHREIAFTGQAAPLPTPVYDRARLGAGAQIDGPAVIEEMSATTLVLPGQGARIDGAGNILID
ncbi:MAG: hydantoinase/oxoprolinase family protein, partial [Alphaproteobacteria bacterium]|nr:hydantoinase/oxoprolinase family protein [Alphaproteobacteria bacterium]